MLRDRIERDGFALVPAIFTKDEVRSAIALLESHRKTDRGGTRDVLEHLPALRTICESGGIRRIVRIVLGEDAFVVRATLFDKTPEANWKVPWHQDVTIAVKERRDTPGYGPWSVKAGVIHVQPPEHVLQRMLTVRVHLDPCPAANGALRLIPGSHKRGKLNQTTLEPYIDEALSISCAAEVGDALVMRPLALHASSASLNPGHRRVLHFDFAVGELAEGIHWRMRSDVAAISAK